MPDAAAMLDLRSLAGAEIKETHGSRVFLSGDRAYKLRKAVRFPFLDQSTPAARRTLALAELRLNRDLAPSTYVGVRSALTEAGEEDVVVEMRRFDEADTLASRLQSGRLDPGMLEELGTRLAAFHATAAPVEAGGVAAALRRVHVNAEELAALTGGELSPAELWRIVRPLEVTALRCAERLEARAAAGHWREGHGDLRAEHVVFDDAGLQIVDRLEFDRDLRIDDVGADLAFLLMDLRLRGFPAAADAVLRAYRAAGGDPGDDVLLALWSGYRATVSLKVALLRGGQPGGEASLDRVPALIALAAQLGWHARVPRVYAVCGAPGTGKSTIAQALARRSGFPVLSSDVIRKASLALEPTERAPQGAYTPAVSAEVYAALGAEAATALTAHSGAIVDASMGDAKLRGVFAGALADGTAVRWVECRAPAAEIDRRVALRMDDPERASDATPAIAARLRASWEPLDEIAPTDHIVVRSDQAPSAILDELERRLDELEDFAEQVEAGFDDLEEHVLACGKPAKTIVIPTQLAARSPARARQRPKTPAHARRAKPDL